MLAKPSLTTADEARIRWVAPDFRLLKGAAPALRGTFALLQDGKYGPSNAPPPLSRPATSSPSSSSDASFGNKGTLTSARQSPAKGGSPARPSSSGSAGSGRGAPTAGGKIAAPAKKVAAAPVKKR